MKYASILTLFLLFGINLLHSQNSNFETGWGDWYADNGVWEIGIPTAGPNSSYQGTNCAATVLAGNYPENVTSRLISPEFKIPTADQKPRLRFWHWFSIGSYDAGCVQIRIKNSSDWVTISNNYYSSCGGAWTRTSVDLSTYADSTVEIAFCLVSTNGSPALGWYLDDVVIETGEISLNNPENWESGLGDWSVDNGNWEVGEPTAGPDSAYQGTNCAATVLAGDYPENVSSRLISPEFKVPAADQKPRLRFWQWFNIGSYDAGSVQIRTKNSDDWVTITDNYYSSSGGVWTRALVDLTSYADSIVEIAFFLESTNGSPAIGWYLDEVTIETGEIRLNNPETWESGLGDWSVDNGSWQVGEPDGDIVSAFQGKNCAGTVLEGNYPENVSTRLISPQFQVPSASQNPRLRFWQWFNIGSYDAGNVQIRTENSDWTAISNDYVSSSGGIWSYASVDLSDYSDSIVEIAFNFISTNGSPGTGWYIDSVTITGMPVYQSVHADFMADDTIGDIQLTVHFTDKSEPVGNITSWKWDFENDGIIDSEEQNPAHTFYMGVFSVKLIVGNGIATDTILKSSYIIVSEGEGTNSEFENNRYFIYPNPVANVLTVQCKISDISKYELFSLDGTLMNRGIIKSEFQEINMDGFSSGVYLLKIYNKYTIQSLKVIKQ